MLPYAEKQNVPDDFFFNIFFILCVYGVWGGMGNVVSTAIIHKTSAIILKNYKRNKREKKEVKACREENDINPLSRRLFIYEGAAESNKRTRTRTRIRAATVPLTPKTIRICTYHDRSFN